MLTLYFDWLTWHYVFGGLRAGTKAKFSLMASGVNGFYLEDWDPKLKKGDVCHIMLGVSVIC